MKITNARLRDRDGLYDVTIDSGYFVAITPTATTHSDTSGEALASRAPDDIDAGGALLCPPFVDAHLHLDYANTVGQPRLNETGTLFEAIDIWAEHKAQGYVNHDTVLANALDAVRAEVSNGVGFIRTHVDVTDPDLTAVNALLELRDQVRDWCHIQIIAFPQNGITAYPHGDKLLEESLRRGVDTVGGIPHFEGTREAGIESLRIVFELAERYGKLVDVHCDEIDDGHSRFLEVMAEETTRRGMQGRVTASHAVAMAYYGPGYMAKLLPKLATADMRFAVNTTENLHLQGWGASAPMPRGVAPIRTLTEAGLNVAFGQDSIADPWYPIGEGDLLRILETSLHVGHMLNESYLRHCLDFITTNGARNMGIAGDYGIDVGKPAHAILLDATDDKNALWHHADVLANIHHGNVVFTRARRTYTRTIPGF